jgi:hypothetical protein
LYDSSELVGVYREVQDVPEKTHVEGGREKCELCEKGGIGGLLEDGAAYDGQDQRGGGRSMKIYHWGRGVEIEVVDVGKCRTRNYGTMAGEI